MCDTHKEIAHNREYRSFNCKKDGIEFMVVSHGVGSAGAAICFEELIKAGAKVIIRGGTCGALQDGIKQGDVIVCSAACKDDGVSDRYVPPGYPAIADTDVLLTTIVSTAKQMDIAVTVGLTVSGDLFYPSPVGIAQSLTTWQKAGVEVCEMEAAALFTICRVRGVRAGAICAVDGAPLKWEKGDYDPHGDVVAKGKSNMLRVAIASAVKLTQDFS
eukprot:CAMPEP_0113847798 /NCGR_PEP_ID=MMETSP0372-20130328/2087_1 /TAXON_ID=340204 /ORGANISM="Lankesteria abbotti" /LENGTH=215 /DNA_ID=CAMNT_0000817141 /DNA_START=145 /DNA_END=792 /DNA_ORIENTATION=- /assembly_acc=CAM_ASM_000359